MATARWMSARNDPDFSEELTLDRLAGDWQIFQLRRGHRFSTDDLLTAWRASRTRPAARRLLDLGAGIGSVGLMNLWRLQELDPRDDQHLTMVEAQETSHRLARKSLAFNRLEAQVTALWGDLRERVPDGPFELITGSPPYIPLGKGVVSPHHQRAACRMELRGTIADYALAAAKVLEPDGRFVCCFAGQDPRAEQAIAAAGFHLLHRTDVYFRAQLPPTICLLTAALSPGPVVRDRLTIRDAQGQWTEEYLSIRREMGTKLALPD